MQISRKVNGMGQKVISRKGAKSKEGNKEAKRQEVNGKKQEATGK